MSRAILLLGLVLCVASVPHTHRSVSRQYTSHILNKYNLTLWRELLPECPVTFTPPDLKSMHQELRTRLMGTFFQATSGLIYIRGPRDSSVYIEPGVKRPTWEYLTGCRDEQVEAVLDISTRQSYMFVPKRDAHWAVWEGIPKTLEEWKDVYGFDHVHYEEDMNTVVASLQWSTVYIIPGETPPFSTTGKVVNTVELTAACLRARPVKTAAEVAVIQLTSQLSTAAHNTMMKYSKYAKAEYNYNALFHYITQLCGSFKAAYPSIVAAGNAAASLHYTDLDRNVHDGQLILIDVGSEYGFYATDITRTFPVNGRFTADQTAVYNAVYNSWSVAAAMVKPGVSWAAVNDASIDPILQGLLDLGCVTGTIQQLRSAGINLLFYPYFLGHSVGIEVHDPGNVDVLQENMVLTIEPGMYFNHWAVEQAFNNPAQSPYLNVNRIRSLVPLGGVRIEDTGVVTASGYVTFATSPKTVAGIEQLMNS